jgi:hypothetical protein
VIRKNRRHNGSLFKQFSADITMQPTEIIAHECLAYLISPLLAQFLSLLRTQTNDWANQLISQLVGVVGDHVPETWAITIDQANAPAVMDFFNENKKVTLAHLTVNPSARTESLAVVPILLVRGQETILLPDLSSSLMPGDRILLCGTPSAKSVLNASLNNIRMLTYIVDGIDLPNSLFWCWLRKKLH